MITVYTKPQCPQCDATKRALDKRGIEYRLKPVGVGGPHDEAIIAKLQELGHRQMPVVLNGKDHWSGFRPDKLAALGGGE